MMASQSSASVIDLQCIYLRCWKNTVSSSDQVVSNHRTNHEQKGCGRKCPASSQRL